jgi:NAD(P)-dependent dehydrogenase (short-subunit alcohol dehydrogenase family)
MSRELEGKVLIVTGAATGIGKAIAFAFGEAGARVVVNHLDTPDLAEAVAAETHTTAARRSRHGRHHELELSSRPRRRRADFKEPIAAVA